MFALLPASLHVRHLFKGKNEHCAVRFWVSGSQQVEQNRRALSEKRRLVRRLTITHHQAYMRREVGEERRATLPSVYVTILIARLIAYVDKLTRSCSVYPARPRQFIDMHNFSQEAASQSSCFGVLCNVHTMNFIGHTSPVQVLCSSIEVRQELWSRQASP